LLGVILGYTKEDFMQLDLDVLEELLQIDLEILEELEQY
jgi:hypothetical protein